MGIYIWFGVNNLKTCIDTISLRVIRKQLFTHIVCDWDFVDDNLLNILLTYSIIVSLSCDGLCMQEKHILAFKNVKQKCGGVAV